MTVFYRWIVLSCDSGMHIASFQDGTVPLSDLEYARGELHNMHPWDAETCILDAMKCACIHQFSTEMVY